MLQQILVDSHFLQFLFIYFYDSSKTKMEIAIKQINGHRLTQYFNGCDWLRTRIKKNKNHLINFDEWDKQCDRQLHQLIVKANITITFSFLKSHLK